MVACQLFVSARLDQLDGRPVQLPPGLVLITAKEAAETFKDCPPPLPRKSCPVPACRTLIYRKAALCADHFAALPVFLRAELWVPFDKRFLADLLQKHNAGKAWNMLQAAQDKAVAVFRQPAVQTPSCSLGNQRPGALFDDFQWKLDAIALRLWPISNGRLEPSTGYVKKSSESYASAPPSHFRSFLLESIRPKARPLSLRTSLSGSCSASTSPGTAAAARGAIQYKAAAAPARTACPCPSALWSVRESLPWFELRRGPGQCEPARVGSHLCPATM